VFRFGQLKEPGREMDLNISRMAITRYVELASRRAAYKEATERDEDDFEVI